MTDDARAIQLLQSGSLPELLDSGMTANALSPTFQNFYRRILQNAINEFPPIDGYETMHHLLCERMAMSFTYMKMQDVSDPYTDTHWGFYKTQFRNFLKTCEVLLREAKILSGKESLVLFKHKFVDQVIDVLDRTVLNEVDKRRVVEELRKLV